MGEIGSGFTILLRAVVFKMSYMCVAEIAYGKISGESYSHLRRETAHS
jgi:hypothetical protein